MRLHKFLILILIGVSVSGCVGSFNEFFGRFFGQQEVRRGSGDKLVLAVQRVNLDHAYHPDIMKLPSGYLYVEREIRPEPLYRINAMYADKLVPAGGDFTARVHVVEASIVEVPLPQDREILGWYPQNSQSRFDLRYDVDLEILDERGYLIASANPVVIRSAPAPENPEQRAAVLNRLADESLGVLEAETDRAVRRFFATFLISPEPSNPARTGEKTAPSE